MRRDFRRWQAILRINSGIPKRGPIFSEASMRGPTKHASSRTFKQMLGRESLEKKTIFHRLLAVIDHLLSYCLLDLQLEITDNVGFCNLPTDACVGHHDPP